MKKAKSENSVKTSDPPCPFCGHDQSKEYVYGFVLEFVGSPSRFDSENYIVKPGCVLVGDEPKYQCKKCFADHGKYIN